MRASLACAVVSYENSSSAFSRGRGRAGQAPDEPQRAHSETRQGHSRGRIEVERRGDDRGPGEACFSGRGRQAQTVRCFAAPGGPGLGQSEQCRRKAQSCCRKSLSLFLSPHALVYMMNTMVLISGLFLDISAKRFPWFISTISRRLSCIKALQKNLQKN